MNITQARRLFLWEHWGSVQQKRLVKRATLTTYADWARHHPEWVVGFFDQHFVSYHVAPLLYQFLQRQQPVDPRCLVEAWADQFHLTPAQRQLRMQSLLPAVVDFLACFKVELAHRGSKQPDWLDVWLQSEWRVPQPHVAPLCQP